jgi:hypothetical protein
LIDKATASLQFNKLICSSTTIPFSVAIVSFKWDFFRDPSSIIEGMNPMDPLYQMQLANLPQRPIMMNSSCGNTIQGQVNFLEMFSHNEKNITITLQASPSMRQDQFFSQQHQSGFKDPMLTLNFNYKLFKDDSQPAATSSMHLLRNLYLTFMLSQMDYDSLKLETMRQLHLNPSLVTLLKTPQAPHAEHQRFTPGGSLHHLFKDQGSDGHVNPLYSAAGSLESPYAGGGHQHPRGFAVQHSLLMSSENSSFSIDEKDKG